MKYTQIPASTFKELQMNAGILLKKFNTTEGSFEAADLLGATSGGVNFSATADFTDFGEDIDNCPKNMKELKQLDTWTATMGGTFVTVNTSAAKSLVAAADIDGSDKTKIVPRNDLKDEDFDDIWWVGDYSDVNTGDKAGYIAVHMLNALSTGGFQIQSGDKTKGTFSFEYTAHYSIEDQEKVPFELFIKGGGDAEGLSLPASGAPVATTTVKESAKRNLD